MKKMFNWIRKKQTIGSELVNYCLVKNSGSSDSSDSDSSDSGVSTREELRAHQEDIDALGLGFAVIGNWTTAQVSKI